MAEPPPPEVEDNDIDSRALKPGLNSHGMGIIELLPCGTRIRKTILKELESYYRSMQRAEQLREVDTYRHLPPHPRLLRVFDSSREGDDVSITLEYMPQGSLKGYLLKNRAAGLAILTTELRCRWALQAAQGVAILHAHGVIHADLKPGNMLLDDELGLRIADFGGCSLLGQPAYTIERPAFCLPGKVRDIDPGCSVATDIFALGSCIFQIATGSEPYEGLADADIEKRFEGQVFPELDGVLFGEVIRKCWFCEFESAEAVLQALSAEARRILGDDDFPSSVLG